MKRKLLLFIVFILCQEKTFSQVSEIYVRSIKEADSLYKIKKFEASSNKFTDAFKANNWKAYPADRYSAAKAWALAGQPDSAFANLYSAIKNGKTQSLGKDMEESFIRQDVAFNSIHKSPKWEELFLLMNKNRTLLEAKYNRVLIAKLDTLYQNDQQYRLQYISALKKYGNNSKEAINFSGLMNYNDSLNVIEVKKIIDEYGWLGEDVIGTIGNQTLFLVIQHSDILTQEKYLPALRDAVNNKRAKPTQLALLEDRINVRRGRKQVYGSQIGQDPITFKYFVQPIEDPENVDLRRKKIGLGTLQSYVKQWDILL